MVMIRLKVFYSTNHLYPSRKKGEKKNILSNNTRVKKCVWGCILSLMVPDAAVYLKQETDSGTVSSNNTTTESVHVNNNSLQDAFFLSMAPNSSERLLNKPRFYGKD